MRKNAVLINFGYGNFNRLIFFLKRLGYEVSIKNIDDSFDSADLLLIPGIGNSNCFNNINQKSDIYKYILAHEKHQNTILGICLGMHLMCNLNKEANFSMRGFNIFPYNVHKLTPEKNYRIPRIGWYETYFNGKTKLENLKLYYSHSFYVDNKKMRDTIMFTKHNKKVIPAVIKNNNIIGVQFHPELSGDSGAEIFKELMKE